MNRKLCNEQVIDLTVMAMFNEIEKAACELADFGVENGEVLVLKRLLKLYPQYQHPSIPYRTDRRAESEERKRKAVSVEGEEDEESQAVVSEDQNEESMEEDEEDVDEDEDNEEWIDPVELQKNENGKMRENTGREKDVRKSTSKDPDSWQDALVDFDKKLTGGKAQTTEMVLKWRDSRARRQGDELTMLEEARDKHGGWSSTYVSAMKIVLMSLWKKLDAGHADRLRKRRDGDDIGELHGTRYFEHVRNEGEDWAFVHLASIVYGIAWQRLSLWPHARVLDLEVVFARLGIGTESMCRKVNQYRVIMENITNKYDQLLSKLGAVDPFRWSSKFLEGPIGMCMKEYEQVGLDHQEVAEDDHKHNYGGDTDPSEVKSAEAKPAYGTRSGIRRQEQHGLGTNFELLRLESAEGVEVDTSKERRLGQDQRRKSKCQREEIAKVDEMARRKKRMRVESESEYAEDDVDMEDTVDVFESLVDDLDAATELSD
ncbi:hypothetical protein HK102_008653 [Quaeritorhiza haematococci]|nr:hypothetical protein HK102_008653 [Quaeritorhiza haematococci]